MLDYYEEWLITRDPLRTHVVNGVPQVEVHALIEIPMPPDLLERFGYDRVLYASTFDRVVIDDMGQLHIVEYKTAKRIQTLFFQTDPQVGAYCWVGRALYGTPIASVIYQQHLKEVPHPPQLAKGRPSIAKNQHTSRTLYRKALLNIFGSANRFPGECVDMLNHLERQESPEADRYIRRDSIERNEYQAESEGAKLMLELEEMLNPDIPLYPSPTRDCGHLCSFNHACVSMDDGSDWEYELELGFTQKTPIFDSWRKYLD
jgi:hypothetical protein